MADNEKTANLNYEAEYNKLREENAYLRMKQSDLDEKHRYMEIELTRLRAQLDIVRLIFGKR